jgi:hypothetical protein
MERTPCQHQGGSQKRYPPELKERGVRMVRETIEAQGGERYGVVTWGWPTSSALGSSRSVPRSRDRPRHPPRHHHRGAPAHCRAREREPEAAPGQRGLQGRGNFNGAPDISAAPAATSPPSRSLPRTIRSNRLPSSLVISALAPAPPQRTCCADRGQRLSPIRLPTHAQALNFPG